MNDKVVAVVGVCDEVELIETCIAHLQTIGVSGIVVIDRASRDGTDQILAQMAADGIINLIVDGEDNSGDYDYFMRGVRLAQEKFSPDWIIFQDADEFWFSRHNNLSEVLAGQSAPVVRVDRFNACLTQRLGETFATGTAGWKANLDIFVQDLRLSRPAMDANPRLRWISAKPAEKVAARVSAIANVSMGGHAIIGSDGAPMPGSLAEELVIVHVPFLTLARFHRKVSNIERLLLRNPDLFEGNNGWHWRRWQENLETGIIDDEFYNQFLNGSNLHELTNAGLVNKLGKWLRI